MHSHALHFYFLAAPDLIIPNGTRKTRNVFQVIKDMPEIALQAINIRRNGLEMVRKIGGRPIHPTSSTPGGISTELDADTQKDLLERAKQNVELAQATLDLAIPVFEENIDLIASLGNFGDTRHCGTVKPDGTWDVYNGNIRFKDKDGSDMFEYRNEEYTDYVAEHVKPFGYAQAPLLFNYARLIELLASAECAAAALEEDLSGKKFPDELERTEGKGVGIVEAPRGTLIHHYESDDNGLCNYANIVVATIQNNPAMEMGIHQVAKDYIKPSNEIS